MTVTAIKAYEAGENVLLEVNLASFQVNIPTNYIFIVDVSGSMNPHMTILKDILLRWLQTAEIGSGLVFVLIRQTGELFFKCDYLSEEKRQVAIHKIQSLYADGQTNIEDGINVAKEAICFLNPNIQNRTIILTDGAANQGIVNPSHLAAITAPMGKVDAVMLTICSDAMFVQQLKLVNSENVGHFAANGDALATVFNDIFGNLNTRKMMVQVGDIVKIIPSYNANSIMDLLYVVNSNTNPIVLVKAEQSNGEWEIMIESRLMDVKNYLDSRHLKARMDIAMAMKKVGLIEDDIVVNNTKANFSGANKKLEEIFDDMLKIKIDMPDIVDQIAYRSLSGSYDKLKEITDIYCAPCPSTFSEHFVPDQYEEDQPIYRSLASSGSAENEQMKNRSSLHTLAAFKKCAF